MFYIELALRLGRTKREMLATVSSYDLAEMIAYNRIQPIGELRADLRAGIVASTLANIHRGKNREAYTPQDFMPYIVRPPVNQAKLLRAQLGHLVVRKNDGA